MVLGFRSSDNLGAAYGIAVTGTMTITTILAFVYMRGMRLEPLWLAVPLFASFSRSTCRSSAANMLKIEEGGWFPLAIAALVFPVMTTWRCGRRRAREQRARGAHAARRF